MIGPRITTVFASRWKALWWSAGILLTAYCSVPSPDETQQAHHPAHPVQKSDHADPWAIAPGTGNTPTKS